MRCQASRAAASSAASATSTAPEISVRQVSVPGGSFGAVAVLTLDRPRAKNAVGRALLAGLRAELAQLRDAAPGNRPRALVLGSAVPGAFCAGADLRERKTMTQDEARAFVDALRDTFTEIAELPVPTVAAVNG